MNFLPEPYTYINNRIKIELDLPSYATKIENETGVATSKFAKQLN